MAERRVPRIRFKGFEEDWEQRKLGEIAKITMGQSPDGSTYSTEEGAYILVQGNADLKDGWVLPRVWTTQKTRTCDAGDLIISVRAPAGAIGRTAYDAVIGRGVAAIKGNEFIFQTLVKLDLNEYWKGSAVGSTFEAINSDVLINQMILIPSELEQKVIGEYFKGLDSLLSLHQRKLEKLKILKKAMLEKMFPKNGEKVPEIRFSGFADDWEQRKFNELYERNDERNNGQFGQNKTISISTMTFNELGNGAADSSIDFYKVLRLGDIAFEGHTNKEFRYGRFGLNDIGNGIMSPRFTTLRPITKQEFTFWKYYIHDERVMRQKLVRSTKAGTMMNELVIDDLMRQSILVPSLSEQKKTGDYFKGLDHLLSLHHRQCLTLAFHRIRRFFHGSIYPGGGF